MNTQWNRLGSWITGKFLYQLSKASGDSVYKLETRVISKIYGGDMSSLYGIRHLSKQKLLQVIDCPQEIKIQLNETK